MTPLDFLRAYDGDRRILRGDYYSLSPLDVEEGDRVGVVLFNLGGPETLDEVEPFLYNLLMDPALLDVPVGGRIRHWLASSMARYRARSLREQYEVIGGGSPLPRLTEEQSEGLQRHLNDQYGGPTGIEFRTYPAMRYGEPSSSEAARTMEADDVDKVVLLPLYPQYSTSMTGSALAYWHALDEANEIPSWPTTTVTAYAANPKYVRALSERIDEALQRFPRAVRDEAVLVFSAFGTPFQDMGEREDSYCCHVHSTVEQIMRVRGRDRPFHTAFQNLIGPSHWLRPSTLETLETIVDRGGRAALVVPVSFVTDHVNTSYELDIEVRRAIEQYGMEYFEVTAGLNTHPLFIQALGEATVAQLDLPIDVNQLRYGGDGLAQNYPLRPLEDLPRHAPEDRSVYCPSCGSPVGARRWGSAEESAPASVSPEQPSVASDEPSEQASTSQSMESSS